MTIARIDINHLPPTKDARSPGDQPELAMIPVDQLVIDTSYQREILKRGWANVQKIAQNFDWSKFSPLMVAARDDGTFAIIDGQHRAHAAALRGLKHVPASISTLTAEEQAAAFSWINGSVTALTPNQVFRAALAAFEPWAVLCDAVVKSAGCTLMTTNLSAKAKKPGQVFAVGTVRKQVEAGHGQYLAAVLQGVTNSDLAEDLRYYNAYGLAALVPAAVQSGITRHEVITAFLNEHDLEKTAHNVRKIMDQPDYRGKTFKAMFGRSVAVLMKSYANS